MIQRLELVIFDMDGLMFDTEQIAFRTWQQAAANAGFALDEATFRLTLGVKIQRTREIYGEHFGPAFDFDAIMKDRYEITDRWIQRDGVPLKLGLVDLLADLQQANVKTAVATSTDRDKAEALIKKAGVYDYFNYIICGNDVTHSKPDPEIFLTAAARLGCQPENCIVLEDSPLGIQAAYRAQMVPVMIPDMVSPTESIRQLIAAEFTSLAAFRLYLAETLFPAIGQARSAVTV